jgi:methionyl-tRNA formyltransferase
MDSRNFRIVFMGTPDFAVPSLRALLSAGYQVAGVVTAPDRPAGRGLKLKPSPVKTFALANNLEVFQPVKLKDEAFLNELKEIDPHLIVVVAFRMLPPEVWGLPPRGSINLHASLLPNYRGAAPIHWAIINGESYTGLTTFFLDEAIDTGKILRQEEILIGPDTTAGELHDTMMLQGADMLVRTVDDIRVGVEKAISQDVLAESATLRQAPKLKREHARIRWSMRVQEVHNQVRGLSPSPGAYSYLNAQDGQLRLLKVFEGKPHPLENVPQPGTIRIDNRRMYVSCGEGWYELLRVQLEGKQPVQVSDLLNGLNISGKSCFDTSSS